MRSRRTYGIVACLISTTLLGGSVGRAQPPDGEAAVSLSPGFGTWSAAGWIDASEPLESRAPGVLAAPCHGFVGSAPDAVLHLAEGVERVWLRTATPSEDALLLLLGPDGFVQCAQQSGRSPGFVLERPRPGRYTVFLGLAEAGDSNFYTLVAEEGGPSLALEGSGEGTGAAPRPAMELAAVVGLPADAIDNAILDRIGDLQTCREDVLQRNPSFTGQIVARWVVGTDGQVTEASIERAEPPEPTLEACVLLVLRSLRFPPPPLETEVTFTFAFVPFD